MDGTDSSAEQDRVIIARLGTTELVVGCRDVITVGRHRHAMLRTNHERVSRRHATIRGEPEGWYFVDEDSMNGSYIGDEPIGRLRIDASIAIRLGDQRHGPLLELRVAEALDPGRQPTECSR